MRRRNSAICGENQKFNSSEKMTSRGLVLDFDENSRTLYCFERTEKKLVSFILGPFCKIPNRGHFLFFDDSNLEKSVESLVSEPPNEDDYVNIDESTKQFSIRAWIGFSDDPTSVTYNKNVGYADLYGLVAIPQEIRTAKHGLPRRELTNGAVYASVLVVNDLNFEKTGGCLFIVDRVKCRILGQVKEPAVVAILRELQLFEKTMFEKSDANVKIDSSVRSSEVNLLSPNKLKLEATEDPIAKRAVGMTFENGNVVFWLDDIRSSAVYRCTEAEAILYIGKTWNCYYREVEGELRVIKLLFESKELPFRVKQVNKNCFAADLEVSLYRPHVEFRDFMFYTNVGILESEAYDMIVFDDNVILPSRNVANWHAVMKIYMGNQMAKRMAGWCQLKEQRVPVRNSEDTVYKYTWTLTEVIGSLEMVRDNGIE